MLSPLMGWRRRRMQMMLLLGGILDTSCRHWCMGSAFSPGSWLWIRCQQVKILAISERAIWNGSEESFCRKGNTPLSCIGHSRFCDGLCPGQSCQLESWDWVIVFLPDPCRMLPTLPSCMASQTNGHFYHKVCRSLMQPMEDVIRLHLLAAIIDFEAL